MKQLQEENSRLKQLVADLTWIRRCCRRCCEKSSKGGEVEKADIVKGFEYAKNKYMEIDPEELKALRIPTATTMQIKQLIKAEELSPALFDRPFSSSQR
jgi:non-homologous end joining protein Ku